jgi:hypothetical protein
MALGSFQERDEMSILYKQLNTGWRRRLDFVPVSLGLVLLVAAVLKAFQLTTESVSEDSWYTTRWFQMALVVMELLLGLLLLTGVWPISSRKAALLCFAVFAAFNVYQIYQGEQSCGCFGKFAVDPWYTLAFDVAAIAALLVWSPVPETAALLYARPLNVLAVFLAASAAALFAMSGRVNLEYLYPETWVGQRLPLLEYISIGDQLSQGEWTVALYRHNCPRCRAAMRRYRQTAQEMRKNGRGARFALIEVPPYGSVLEGMTPCIPGRLSDAKYWGIELPCEMTLKDGVVLTVQSKMTNLGKLFEETDPTPQPAQER